MKILLLAVGLLAFLGVAGQCSLSADLSTSGTCLGATLTVSSSSALAKIVWNNNQASVATVTETASYATSGITVAGGIYPGSSLSQFNAPTQIWVDAKDNVYVADGDNDRIMKWAPGATSGVIVVGAGGRGSAANQLRDPEGVFVDNSGAIYISDAGNNRVQKWALGATSGVTVAGGNGAGSAANQLNNQLGLFVDGAGNVYVVDAYNERVQEWRAGAINGTTVAGGLGSGSAANQLFGPADVFVDKSGNVFVADGSNSRIQEWPAGASNGLTVAGGNYPGGAANQLDDPRGVFVDGTGNIFIADNGNSRIQEWAPGATSGTTVAGKGYDGDAPDLLAYPSDVWLDKDGNVFIADQFNYRIQEYTVQSNIDNTYTPIVPGDYAASVYDLSGCLVATNDITLNPYVTPGVSINGGNGPICSGSLASFSAVPVNGGASPTYQWLLDGNLVGGDGAIYSTSGLSNGDVITCTMTSDVSCPMAATVSADPVTVAVVPGSGVSVAVMPAAVTVCSGVPVTFNASSTNGGSAPVFQWFVNGHPQGSDSTGFTTAGLLNADTVSCLLTSSAAAVCSTAVSTPVVVNIEATPVISPSEVFSIDLGQSVELTPTITGSIAGYSWSPALGLSDTSIADPVASPSQSTSYELTVVSTDGCVASAPVVVKVFPASPTVLVPNAFTPNGDGKNDVFYILRAPVGSVITDFAVFDRFGQRVFQGIGVTAGDRSEGWNGSSKGLSCEPGTYAYVIRVKAAEGKETVYKGTVILVR